LNLRAQPDCEAFVDGRWRALRAGSATERESDELWPRLQDVYAGFEHYRAIATHELPIVLLAPR
jgi:hypothetical protein